MQRPPFTELERRLGLCKKPPAPSPAYPQTRAPAPEGNHVYGPFTLKNGRLTFRTGDAALLQRLAADRDKARAATVYLLSVRPIEEFAGHLTDNSLVPGIPAQWNVIMRAAGRRPRLHIVAS